jgi:hypothetical protein
MKKIVLVISILAFIHVTLFAQEAKPENKNAPILTFDKKLIDKAGNFVWDYGTIYKDANGDSYFAFKNTGKEPLVLSEVRSSCGCTVPKWPREPILPGKSDTIKVKYSTNRLGVINKSITVNSNAVNNPVILRIAGNVIEKPQEVMPVNKSGSEGQPVNK